MIRRRRSSMVKLKNIVKNNNMIQCDIYPEDSKEKGFITVNVITGELESYVLPKEYEWCMNHLQHAKRALLDMVKADKMQDEKVVMWC